MSRRPNLPPTAIHRTRGVVLALTVGLVVCAGCSTVRLPRIDPTGNGLFMSGPAYTSLVSPCEGSSRWSCLPQPAFMEPAPPPPCDPYTSLPTAPVLPADTGVIPCPPLAAAPLVAAPASLPIVPQRLVMAPRRVVSPVGAEVVVLAGVCEANGTFSARRSIEWMLSQDSVGHFVAVGQADECHHLSNLLHKPSRTLTSNFATARTAHTGRRLTRGTPAPDDDVFVAPGQSWISVTSASEGTSYVTAVAADAEHWEHRRQTAIIQWVDGQWSVPGPAVVPAGQGQRLSTRITRASDHGPVTNWRVKYEVASGPDVQFLPADEVATDANGDAAVEVRQLIAQPGATTIRVRMLAPTSASATVHQAVGEATTSITWSAAGLAVRTLGPAQAAVDGVLTYRIEVSNPGDLPSRDVVTTIELPPILRYLSSSPAASPMGARYEWRLSELPPQMMQTFEITCQAVRDGEVTFCARAAARDTAATEPACVTTLIQGAALALEVVPLRREVLVGEEAGFNIRVRNTGAVRLTNVQVRDTFDRAFAHPSGAASPLVQKLGDLEPGQQRDFAIALVAQEPGELCHALEAWADGGQTTQVRSCVTATAPRSAVRVQVVGPDQIVQGTAQTWQVRVTNTGLGRLASARLLVRAAASLVATEVTAGFVVDQQALRWDLPALAAGDAHVIEVKYQAEGVDAAAEIRATVITPDGMTDTATATTRIVARGAAAPPATPPGPPAPNAPAEPSPFPNPAGANRPDASGELRLTFSDIDDPIRVGDTTVYLLQIENARQVSDQQIAVVFKLGEGWKVRKVESDGVTLRYDVAADGRTVAVQSLAELRPGERRLIRLEVLGERPGKLPVQVEVTSQRQSRPTSLSAQTDVFAN